MRSFSNNRQLGINMIASVLSFFVGLCIKFFLAPYIVSFLGTEAYGFIGLSADIISYTSLITIAFNSMAGRFITIEYTTGHAEEANKFFSSVFFSNVLLSIVILIIIVFCIIWLEYIIVIPVSILEDVKVLFGILVVNNIIGLICGTWNVATFIKNRLDLSNIRNVIGSLINALALLLLFIVFPPRIWYVGVAGLIMTIYVSITNFRLSKKLTPELVIKKANCSFSKIKILVSSGIWNVLNKLSDVLGYGLDLIIANLFLGATYMGIFALTRNVPFLILSLFQMVSAVFAPIQTQLYAQGEKGKLKNELSKSIRLLGFFATIPITCLYIWGTDFYSLWLPTEDAKLLQLITILGTLDFIVSMPLESLWNIFTITNKLKYSSLTLLFSCVLIAIIVCVSMLIVESPTVRLYVLACTRSVIYFIRSVTFLPLYGAYCLNLPKTFFYKPILKSCICTLISLLMVYSIRLFISVDSWGALVWALIPSVVICCLINYFFIFTKSDRSFVSNKIQTIIKNI